MNVLVWQWGRRGAGPRFGAALADGMGAVAGTRVSLSLSAHAEIMRGGDPPGCVLPVKTYASALGFAGRLASAPFAAPGLARRVAALAPDVAICAMPGPLDLLMTAALARARVPAVVVVHDAVLHPGDGLLLQMTLQRRLLRRADALAALSTHVADTLRMQGFADSKPLYLAAHPPLVLGPPPPPPFAHDGPPRLLMFGRLLPYKGLDLLADALPMLAARYEIRVAGSGPASADLARLAALPAVRVENRWVPEPALAALIGWADALVLPYREASQSGAAAAALAAGRFVIATDVGGLSEQLRGEPLARLCAPDAASLAAALNDFLAASPSVTPPLGAPRDAWRRMAERLLADIAARPPRGYNGAPVAGA